MLLNTKLQPIDNSQIKLIKIIYYLPKKIKIGTFFSCILKKLTSKFKFDKKVVYLGLITNWKCWKVTLDNTKTLFHNNGCIILNKSYKPLATKTQKLVSKNILVQRNFNKANFQKVLTFFKNNI